jgi:hypothetical protein
VALRWRPHRPSQVSSARLAVNGRQFHTVRWVKSPLAKIPEWTIPALDFAGVPTGIDVRLVVETGLAPVINTGIAHREPGIGQVGAGVVRAPMACFRQAVVAIAEDLGVS